MKHLAICLVAAAALCTQAATAQNRVKNVYASNKTLNVELLQNEEQDVQLNRYLYAGYNSLCLPMTLSSEQLAASAEGIHVERLAGIHQEGSTLCLYFADCTDEGIQAGMPYLVYSPQEQYLRARTTDALAVDTDLKQVRMIDGEGNQVTFSSSWEAIKRDGRYGIPAQQNAYPLESVLVRTESDKTFLPTRCGFTWDEKSATATELKIEHVGSLAEVTAIKGLKTADGNVDVYDLRGNIVRRQAAAASALSGLPAGIYVVGGEKVAVQ